MSGSDDKEKPALFYRAKADAIASDEAIEALRTKQDYQVALNNVRRMYYEDVNILCDHIDEQRAAIEGFVTLLTCYYWHADDPELAAVNRLRRLIGWRDQLPKGEALEGDT